MIITSNRIITFEQAKKVASLFTYEDYADKSKQVYLEDEKSENGYVLVNYTKEVDELLQLADLFCYYAPTYSELQRIFQKNSIWLCEIQRNHDYSTYWIGYEYFRMYVFNKYREITPSHLINANIELYHLVNRYNNLHKLPF